MYRSWFADQAMAEYFTAPAVSNVTGAAALARLRGEGYDWSPVLRALSTPALVVHGERDPLPPSVALELAALLPQASAVILPDAGHMPFWEAPIPFFTAVDDFLTGSTGR
jgi:Predicted hydrolases or acyltransferases (alpha/beta hydrolase superfamily)